MRETIFAVATPPGRGAIAIIRISGSRAHDVIGLLGGAVVADRRLRLCRFRWRGEFLDEGLTVCFPPQSSVTGEAYAELHLHGGRAVAAAVIGALSECDGLREAAPGEFSRRSLAAGKMDLAQLEGVADLVAAETVSQRKQALRLIGGDASREVAAWRALLLDAWALLEAAIDFSDEELPPDLGHQIALSIGLARNALRTALDPIRRATALREGYEVVLAGPPNVGKSSILNAIAGRRVALTSPEPGTTRDCVELRLELDGMPVRFVDTAGDREVDDHVEAEGVAMGRARRDAADLVIRVSAPDVVGGAWSDDAGDISVWNKCDLGSGPGLQVSAATGAGIDLLLGEVARRLADMSSDASPLSRLRHHSALTAAIAALDDALTLPPEVAVERVREATGSLDSIVGRIDSEDVLSEIFGRFCIGK